MTAFWNLKKIVISAMVMVFAAMSLSLVASPAVYASASKNAACEGIGLAGAGGCGSNAGNDVFNLVFTIVNILSVVVGIAAVIMIIVAGFKYITSGGDASGVASAKSTLIYAIVGLVIVALAQFIVNFVLKQTN